jgi:hypothetical protein
MNLKNTIEQKLSGHAISWIDVLAAAKRQDALLQEAHELLGRCEKQVGLDLGELIAVFDAKLTGKRFNGKEFNYERSPDGQE